MAEIQLYMHPKRQFEILKEYVVKLTKIDGSELSGEKFKEKLTDIIQHNKNINLKGDIPKSLLSGLNKSSHEALIKGVERAYAEIRLEAEYTQNHPNVQSVRQSNMSGMRNWVAQHRATRNAQQHRNRANAMQRAHMTTMTRQNLAASTIQRMLGSRSRRTHVSRTAARPPLPSIRSRRTRTGQ